MFGRMWQDNPVLGAVEAGTIRPCYLEQDDVGADASWDLIFYASI